VFGPKVLSTGLLLLATAVSTTPWVAAYGTVLLDAPFQQMEPNAPGWVTVVLDDASPAESAVAAEIQMVQDLIVQRQFEKAMEAVEALERKLPTSPTVMNLKGAIYLGKDDVVRARESFERAMQLRTTSTAAAVNLAQLDMAQGNPEAARQRFVGILSKDAANVQAMIGLAGLAAISGQDAQYAAWLERAIKAAPSDVRPRALLANYYLQKNEVRTALKVAQEAQRAAPRDARALDLLGTAQRAAGDREQAADTYLQLVALLPRDPVAYYKLASAQADARRIPAAIESLNKALALKHDYLDAELLLGSIEIERGSYGDALKIVRQLEKQHPDSPFGPLLEGDVLMKQKQFKSALLAYEKAQAIKKSGLIAVRIHQALAASGNAEEADTTLLRWLDNQPRDAVSRAYLAAAYLKEGRSKQAAEQYRRVLEDDPRNIRALNDLAWLYHQEKDPRALATAEQAHQVAPDNPHVMDTLAWILVEQGKTGQALDLLRQAAKGDPASTAIRYHLAVALAKSDDKKRARKELEDLLARNKTFPERTEAQSLLGHL